MTDRVLKTTRLSKFFWLLKFVCFLMLLKIVATTIISYRDYFPPNFDVDFLRGRQPCFFNGYQWAFYVHIVSGPCSLLMGAFLISKFSRNRFPSLHRTAGKIQIGCVLLLIVPSGFWMAFYAQSGMAAGVAFMTLSLLTGVSALMGYRAAIVKKFGKHQIWMGRCFALLCSAIVLRMIGGLLQATGYAEGWIYPASAWACWIIPLLIHEGFVLGKNRDNASS